MNRALAIAAFAFSAVALGYTLTRPAPAAVPAPATDHPSREELQQLQHRIAVLESSSSELWARVGSQRSPPADTAPQVQALRDDVQQMINGDARFKELVRGVQTELAAEQHQQAQQWVQQHTLERKEKWKAFIAEQHLPYATEQELTRRLDAEDARRLEAYDAGQRPDFAAVRAERKQTDEAMARLLTPEQKARYDEVRRDDGPRRGGERPR